MQVRIYQPPKNTMQSGRAGTDAWVLEYELETPRRPEPLMGWTASGDTLNQVRLKFPTREAAEAFARRKGWRWSVVRPRPRRIQPKNYADNFRYEPPPAEDGA